MFKKILSSQLRMNMFSGVASTIVNTIVLAVAYPVYLHFLGYERYGVWLVLATVLTFTQLGNLGIGPAVMKFVAEEYSRGDIEGIQHYVTTALALLCVSGIVALIVILALKNPIIAAFKLSDENAKMVSWLLPYVGVLSIYAFVVQVFEAVLSGLGRMDLTNYIQSLSRGISVAVAGLLLFTGFDVKSMLISSILSYLVIHIASLVCIWRIVHIRLLRISNLSSRCCKRLLSFGLGLFGASVISMLSSPFYKLMLSRYVGISVIPIYEVAYNGAVQIYLLVDSILRPVMPETSRLSGLLTTVAVARIRTINRRLIKLVLYYGLPFYTLIFLTAEPLLRFWLRDNYISALPFALRLILVGTFLNLLGVPAYQTLLGLGKVKYPLVSAIIISGGNFVLVLGRFILAGQVSVISIFVGLVFLYAISTIYLTGKAYCQMNSLQVAVATNG
jgi:O-antigen/teichoic acid export membrane protein